MFCYCQLSLQRCMQCHDILEYMIMAPNWDNHMIDPVHLMQPWRILVNVSRGSVWTDYVTTVKQCTTIVYAYFMGYIVNNFCFDVTCLLGIIELTDNIYWFESNMLIWNLQGCVLIWATAVYMYLNFISEKCFFYYFFNDMSYRWLSARLQWLQCISNGVTAVLH